MNRIRRDRGGVLKVLLIIVGVLLLVCVLIGIYVATHWKGWAADAANAAAQAMVNETEFPQDQKNTILAEIRRVGSDFREGRMSVQEMGRVMRAIGEGPLIPLAAIQETKHKYIEESDMTDAEKKGAILTVQRFTRGVHERKIRTEDVGDVVAPIANRHQKGQWDFKHSPTRMEVDEFLANAKIKADEAKIPEEPFEFNIAEELKDTIREGRQ